MNLSDCQSEDHHLNNGQVERNASCIWLLCALRKNILGPMWQQGKQIFADCLWGYAWKKQDLATVEERFES